jgi:hypothetical protein
MIDDKNISAYREKVISKAGGDGVVLSEKNDC